MINIKKTDDFDFVFINRKIKNEEEHAFSDFLKQKKMTRDYKMVSTFQNMNKMKAETFKVESI
jgi:hypothetical protein